MKNTKTYHELVQKMRTFFVNKNFIEVPSQSRLSILAACENPHSVKTFEYSGEIWPLPQTGQMWLEYELLKNPEWDGVFCISTSYREEKNPIPGRHELIFPMFALKRSNITKVFSHDQTARANEVCLGRVSLKALRHASMASSRSR